MSGRTTTADSEAIPLVTIAVLSWNRLHYLRATLESAHRCIRYPNIQWIVSDNNSTEPGLREYIEGLDWVQHKIFKTQSHGDAMNQILEMTRGRYLLLWPDDIQFVVAGNWLSSLIEIMEANAGIGSIALDALRLKTLKSLFSGGIEPGRMLRELFWYRSSFRRPMTLTSADGYRVKTLGWRASGINGSGIPSLCRTWVWRKLGAWRENKGYATGLVDSSGGAEGDMFLRFFNSRLPLQMALPLIPVAGDIITDPTGCKAKVRGNFRYGVYMPPQSADAFYYKILEQSGVAPLDGELPLSFSQLIKPVGFSIPVDADGDRLKCPINTSVVYDIRNGEDVKYPLTFTRR